MPGFVAALLRAHTLVSRDLWHDEALQHGIANAGGVVDVVQAGAAIDLHPPLYSLLLSLLITGPTWFIRVPSLVAGVLGVWLAYRIGGKLAGPVLAHRFAWLAAVAPAWVAYGHEARPYALGVLLVLALYDELVSEAPREARLMFWGCACALWQYGTALVALAALFSFARVGRHRWAWWSTCSAAALCTAFLASVHWSRGQSIVSELPGFVGGFAPLGLVDLAGWWLTVTPGHVSFVAGVIVWVAAWRSASSVLSRRIFEAAVIPLAIAVGLAALGLYPMGAIRQSLPFTVALLVLSAGFLRQTGSFPCVAGLICAIGITLGRAPGVPVENQRAVLSLLAEKEGPRWVHPSASPAFLIYSDAPAARHLKWGEAVEPIPHALWLLASGRACQDWLSVPADVEVSARLDAEGACALWLTPRGT